MGSLSQFEEYVGPLLRGHLSAGKGIGGIGFLKGVENADYFLHSPILRWLFDCSGEEWSDICAGVGSRALFDALFGFNGNVGLPAEDLSTYGRNRPAHVGVAPGPLARSQTCQRCRSLSSCK